MIPATGLWRNRDFVILWLTQSISLLGSSVTFLALPLIAASTLHATPFQMGILNTVGTLPAMLLGLLAGVWIDRYRRRPILIISNFGQALLLVAVSLLAFFGWLRMEYLYLFGFAIAILRLFFDVANQSFLPSLIGREQLVEGNSKMEISRSAVAVIGPGLAGGLVQLFTAPLAIVFDALTFVIAGLGVAAIRTPEQIVTTAPQRMHHAIGEGLRLVVGERTLRKLTGALITSALFTAMLDAVLLLYLTRDLKLEAGMIGVAFGVGSIGFMVGALLEGRLTTRFGMRLTLMIGLVLTGFGDLLIPMVTGKNAMVVILLTIFVAQFFFGMGRTTFSIGQISLRQRVTPDHMQGRMNATINFVRAISIAVGGLLGGWLGSVIGLQWTLIVAAIGEILAAGWLLTGQDVDQ